MSLRGVAATRSADDRNGAVIRTDYSHFSPPIAGNGGWRPAVTSESNQYQDVDGEMSMFRLFRMIWVNAIEQTKYQMIHA